MAKKFVLKKSGGLREKYAAVDEKQFTINYEKELNPSQYEAVTAVEGNYLIIAGAGTGKTRTLVYRVARLVELGVNPQAILLLTFTRKAAREMMNRAAVILDNRCEQINGGTFHSFANLTLRRYGKFVGLNPNFTILDQGDSEDVINLIRSQIDLGSLKKRFPNKTTLVKVYSLARNKSVPIENIVEREYPHFLQFLDKMLAIYGIYEKYKRENQLLDYDDLLVRLNEFLLLNNSAVEHFLNGIEFIMVDEYQDTNKIQAEIVKNLSRKRNNVMVVGDDSQSIYSLRGAHFQNIMKFPELFHDVKIIKLEENYRSTQGILDFANHIIANSAQKYSKRLFSKTVSDELPVIVSAKTENMQSRFIVEKILELREEGVPLQEIAVLFRSSYFSFDLELELVKANIPFVKFGGMKLIESAHIKDMLAFMRVAVNPNDLVSWYRILLLHEGIGPKKAQNVLNAIGKKEIRFDGEIPEYNAKDFGRFETLFETVHALHKGKYAPAEMAEIAFQYYNPLFKEKYNDHNKRRKDIEIFTNIASNYRSVDSFLADMALEPPRDSVVEVDAEGEDEEFVTLSTIHSAKGLEWHTVFVINALEGFFPTSQAFESEDALEEERRLMYVAVTRAKRNLFVTYPMNIFDRFQGTTLSMPSRFISGISDDLAEEWIVEEEF
jgi:DNA helicase-2/ATP-dependent DNA helicase PcrA